MMQKNEEKKCQETKNSTIEKLEKKLQNQPRPLTEKEKYDIETLIKDLPEGQLKESFRRAISAEKKHGML